MGRTFYEGDDQFWTALTCTMTPLRTWNGTTPMQQLRVMVLSIYKWMHLKIMICFIGQGMVQSWNQLCFTQGKLVISARLANKGTVSGLWPGDMDNG